MKKVTSVKPRSRGLPEGLLDQPFYGWGFVGKNRLARFSVLITEPWPLF